MTKLNEIIQIIGKKRFVFLAVLLVFAGGLAFVLQSWMLPNHEQLTTQKSGLESDKGRLQREFEELPQKYKELKENEVRYEALVNRGFMTDQNRIVARSDIDAIRMRTGLRGISYSIAPKQVVDTSQSGGPTDSQMIRTGIDVEMKGLSDLEMRDFITQMTTSFRGLVVMKNLELKLENVPDDKNLASLANKMAIDFVSGKVTFDWYTAVPLPANAQGATP